MALNWSVADVSDYEAICYVGEGDERRVSVVTEQLVWLSMPCGYGRIREDNVDEIHRRIERLFDLGWHSIWQHGKKRAVTLEEVRAHIGLVTNASKKSACKFDREIDAELSKAK